MAEIVGTLNYELKESNVRIFVSRESLPLFVIKDLRKALGLKHCIAFIAWNYSSWRKRIVEIFTECDSEFVATLSPEGIRKFIYDCRAEGLWIEELNEWFEENINQIIRDAEKLEYVKEIGYIW